VPKDYPEAAKWYRLAAQQGEVIAQYNLGLMYYRGNGVAQDYAEAARWYFLAAEQGNANAQFNLGGMYYQGWGVPQNDADAYKWFILAAEQGNKSASLLMNSIAEQMPPEKIAQAKEAAKVWSEQHKQ
jgi:hypothetical protein